MRSSQISAVLSPIERFITRGSLLIVILVLMGWLGVGIYALSQFSVAEAHLNPAGSAYELNLDNSGRLWISDFKARQIWAIDTADGTYQVYPVDGSPVDARQAQGWLWWADGPSNIIGRISTTDGSYSEWQVPNAVGFLGTSIDPNGRLYATDSSNPTLYRLDPGHSELCTYSLPGYGASNYIVYDREYLWLGDWFDAYLLRLDTVDNSISTWALPAGSSPFGMVVDEQGNIWYADQGTRMLVRLDPVTNQLSGFMLPKGEKPQMVARQSGLIWYSEQRLPSIGRLDPSMAQKSEVTLTIENQQLSPDCGNITPSNNGVVSITQGKIQLRDTRFHLLENTAGWQIYQLPAGADPWGIALTDHGYVVDSGRQVLVRFVLPQVSPAISSALATETLLQPTAAQPVTIAVNPTAEPPTATQLQPTAILPTVTQQIIPLETPSPGYKRLFLPVVVYAIPVETQPIPTPEVGTPQPYP